jgi:hypothetical protein
MDLMVASDLCVVFLLFVTLFWRLWCSLYICIFTKVVPFDLGKVVVPSMGVSYGRAAAVPMLAKLFDAYFRGLFNLVDLATWKSSLISLDSAQNMSISTHREIKKRFAHLCNN